jgi:hypothetical protein
MSMPSSVLTERGCCLAQPANFVDGKIDWNRQKMRGLRQKNGRQKNDEERFGAEKWLARR